MDMRNIKQYQCSNQILDDIIKQFLPFLHKYIGLPKQCIVSCNTITESILCYFQINKQYLISISQKRLKIYRTIDNPTVR